MKEEKKMKKILATILVLALVLSLAACGNAPAKSESPEPQEKAETFKVGILQQLEHPALDAATEGFKQALTDRLGDRVSFDFVSAQNDINNCTTIANKFVSDKVGLIMANATSALQAAASATGEIPVVGVSITDYESAGVLKGDPSAPGGNVTGASDLAPLDLQAKLLVEVVPEAKTVGIVYCSSEANSIYQAETIKVHFEELGLKVKNFTVADSNEIQPVVTAAVEEVDALYIPTDNTMADNMELVKNITLNAKIPVISGEENACKNGGLVTLSISYFDMGYKAGELAADILEGKAEPATSPIVYCTEVERKFNPEVKEALGIELPADISPIE